MFKKLTFKLEKIFDHDSSQNLALEHSINEARSEFEITENLAHLNNLSYVYNFEVNAQNIETLFTQIACYFEINFLLFRPKTNQGLSKKFKTKNAILYGRNINNIEVWPLISLPNVPLYKVFKTNSHAILKKIQLQDLDREKKMFCYLLKLSDDCVLVLATQTAEPWAKLRIETLQSTLMKINFNL
ncbi:MAG: hypothetical protein ACXVAX_01435 [Pseudobdellovibrio sp.]